MILCFSSQLLLRSSLIGVKRLLRFTVSSISQRYTKSNAQMKTSMDLRLTDRRTPMALRKSEEENQILRRYPGDNNEVENCEDYRDAVANRRLVMQIKSS